MHLAVGTPVTQRPPHKPYVRFSRIRFFGCTRFRADLHSCPLQDPVAIPCSEVCSNYPALHVRYEFPLQAACSRQVLSLVLKPFKIPKSVWLAFPANTLASSTYNDQCVSPPWAQGSIRVGGYPLRKIMTDLLPDRDFHPARYAEFSSAR